MNKVLGGLLVLLAANVACLAQNKPTSVVHHRQVYGQHAAPNFSQRQTNRKAEPSGAMPIDKWFSLVPLRKSPALSEAPEIDTKQTNGGTEEITVYGRSHKRDDDWRMDSAAKVPQYEASNSDAAQPMVPYPTYTSPDQQQMMSEKTDALGLCGALGGYIQCPNLPP